MTSGISSANGSSSGGGSGGAVRSATAIWLASGRSASQVSTGFDPPTADVGTSTSSAGSADPASALRAYAQTIRATAAAAPSVPHRVHVPDTSAGAMDGAMLTETLDCSGKILSVETG
jgi:hypothetical protein